MCEPTTLAAFGTWLAGTGGATAATTTAATAATAAGATAATTAAAATAATAATTAAAGMTAAQMLSLGLSAAGAGAGVFSVFSQAQAQKKVAENNAKIAATQAKDALSRGEKAAQEARQRGSQIEGSQRAALAARGLDLSEGTANNILGQSDFFTQSDVATVRTNARKEAQSAQAQKAGFQAAAANALPALGLAGSLLGSGGKVADKWYAFAKG